MMSAYLGREAVLATMHGKERAIAPPLHEKLGLEVRVPADLDTDALGTFTREVPRPGTIEETAVAKARLGMVATGLPIGLASEGSYGPHPRLPFASAGFELLVLVDDERGIVVSDHLVDEATNFTHALVDAAENLGDLPKRARFPEHGLVVRPNVPFPEEPLIYKGLRTRATLEDAIERCAAASSDARALIETDMRAHQNPTRMATIGQLAQRLAIRLLTRCPACASPGFGMVGVEEGLPCEACGAPSTLMRCRIFGCPACKHREERPRIDGLQLADPRWCSWCNP